MKRKKWTPKEEVTDDVLRFREKRKWQISLRRYLHEQHRCSFYAPYFGLDIKSFREWISLQFDSEMTWENFSETWQLDHIVPVAYFDFDNEADLRLCWNFINIRVEKLNLNKNKGNRIDLLSAKSYFENLFHKTQYHVCADMIKKIEQIEATQINSNHTLQTFIAEKKEFLETISAFSSYEYDSLNRGLGVKEILEERAFLKKYSDD